MAVPIVMPQLGYMMEEGTLGAWFKHTGELVQAGELVAEVSTEKINFELQASSTGFLYTLVAEGDVVPVNQVIGYLLKENEELPTGPDLPSVAYPQRDTPQFVSASQSGQELRASPAARRAARELGIEISSILGTGPGGRIVEEDVQLAVSKADLPDTAKPSDPDLPGTVLQTIPLTGLRGAIAQRMVASVGTAAQYTITLEMDVTDALSMRREFSGQQRGAQNHGVRWVDILVRAVAIALQRHPRLNALVVRDQIYCIREAHIGVAVALDDGVLVPVIRDAYGKTVVDISRETLELESKAKTGKLNPDEYTGSTFTISALGQVDVFTPIINPPEVAVLGVGRAVRKPILYEGQVVPRFMMNFSLTLDHRAVDGVPGARFLRRLERLLVQPIVLFHEAN